MVCACSVPPCGSLDAGSECGGREPLSRSCLRGRVVARSLTCKRGKVVSSNREVVGLSIKWKRYGCAILAANEVVMSWCLEMLDGHMRAAGSGFFPWESHIIYLNRLI